ncbi:MAG: aspartate--tRNA ligase [Clostridiales bacterium]|nr:aspartate--tRNA ligase [Clostridiales bacterium]
MTHNEYRTNNCGELRMGDVGKTVKIAGWVNSIRNLGGLTFLTIRDHFGITQVILDGQEIPNKESVVSIEGKVVERESKNPKMPTGDIEIKAESIVTLGACNNTLPFEISDAQNTKEELRLKYRYLDLRNPETHSNIVLRSKLLQYIRNYMHTHNFLEVQTPILTSSSPEGARDFLVPSRLNPGKFFALPQAPQQFKQLLMISGFDNYFQIAPCFRDEDARADRSPGEFYQMDMEMSFATQEDVFAVVEELMGSIIKEFAGITLEPKFQRMTYNDAMRDYCSDKPDLRNPLKVVDLSEGLSGAEFSVFNGKTIKCIKAKCDKTRKFYDEMTKFVVDNEGKGLCWFKVTEEGLTGSAVKFLKESEIKYITETMATEVGDSLFMVADTEVRSAKLISTLRNKLGEELNLLGNEFKFVWIVDFPFYELDDEGKVEFSHNPFSMPQGGLDALLNKNPLDIYAYQYDLVLNGVELLSGAVRNHTPEVMVKAFEIAGYDESVVVNKFPALFNAFSYGAPPHAGCAFGFDRLLMFLCNTTIIRDVIAFPLNKNAQDLLMGAPSTVSQKQLDDVHIKLNVKED